MLERVGLESLLLALKKKKASKQPRMKSNKKKPKRNPDSQPKEIQLATKSGKESDKSGTVF